MRRLTTFETPIVAAALTSLAEIQGDAGVLLAARETLGRALDIHRMESGGESLATANTRLDLGKLPAAHGRAGLGARGAAPFGTGLARFLPSGHPEPRRGGGAEGTLLTGVR